MFEAFLSASHGNGLNSSDSVVHTVSVNLADIIKSPQITSTKAIISCKLVDLVTQTSCKLIREGIQDHETLYRFGPLLIDDTLDDEESITTQSTTTPHTNQDSINQEEKDLISFDTEPPSLTTDSTPPPNPPKPQQYVAAPKPESPPPLFQAAKKSVITIKSSLKSAIRLIPATLTEDTPPSTFNVKAIPFMPNSIADTNNRIVLPSNVSPAPSAAIPIRKPSLDKVGSPLNVKAAPFSPIISTKEQERSPFNVKAAPFSPSAAIRITNPDLNTEKEQEDKAKDGPLFNVKAPPNAIRITKPVSNSEVEQEDKNKDGPLFNVKAPPFTPPNAIRITKPVLNNESEQSGKSPFNVKAPPFTPPNAIQITKPVSKSEVEQEDKSPFNVKASPFSPSSTIISHQPMEEKEMMNSEEPTTFNTKAAPYTPPTALDSIFKDIEKSYLSASSKPMKPSPADAVIESVERLYFVKPPSSTPIKITKPSSPTVYNSKAAPFIPDPSSDKEKKSRSSSPLNLKARVFTPPTLTCEAPVSTSTTAPSSVSSTPLYSVPSSPSSTKDHTTDDSVSSFVLETSSYSPDLALQIN